MFCLLLSGCSKEEVLEKYNAVVEKVGEVQLSLKLGKMSADSACCYIYHQPKMPAALKKMKKL